MKSFMQFLRDAGLLRSKHRTLDEVIIVKDSAAGVLSEGKWIKGGSHEKSLRIDRNTHMRTGEEHAHLYGRKNELLGVIRTDGSRSHRCDPFRVPDKDADKLRSLGWNIPSDNLIEWTLLVGDDEKLVQLLVESAS